MWFPKWHVKLTCFLIAKNVVSRDALLLSNLTPGTGRAARSWQHWTNSRSRDDRRMVGFITHNGRLLLLLMNGGFLK